MRALGPAKKVRAKWVIELFGAHEAKQVMHAKHKENILELQSKLNK